MLMQAQLAFVACASCLCIINVMQLEYPLINICLDTVICQLLLRCYSLALPHASR